MKKTLIIIIVILLFISCGIIFINDKSDYISETDEKPNILLNGEEFDCNVEECVAILNDDLNKEKLKLNPNDYQPEEITGSIENYNEQKDYEYTIYRYSLGEDLEVAFYSLNNSNGKINSFKITSTETESDLLKAEKCYKVICKNICPGFNVDKFLSANERSYTYKTETGEITFSNQDLNANTDDKGLHKIKEYYITGLKNKVIL